MKDRCIYLTLELIDSKSLEVIKAVKSIVDLKGERRDIEDALQRLTSNGLHILIDPGLTPEE